MLTDNETVIRVLVKQVDSMNVQLYDAEKRILNLQQMDINITRLIFMMTMIMLAEAATVAILAWRIWEG